MSRTTTALVLTEVNGPFRLQEVYLDAMQPDEVLVEIHASGICHTDLSLANGTLPCTANAVLGHEGGGVVVEAGPAVKSVSPGDKILLSFSHCGTCAQCAAGSPAYCHHLGERNFCGHRPDGSSAMLSASDKKTPLFSSFFGQSSFARYTLVHRSSVVRVPPDTPLDLFAPLGCGVQTGAGAVLNTLDVRPGRSFAVFGVGAVGISAVMAARIRSAHPIVAVDLQPARLDLARRLGATHCICVGNDSSPDPVDEQVRRLCPPTGADFAVDCTGSPAVIRSMIDALGVRGRGATIGASKIDDSVSVDITRHLQRGKVYMGCSEGDSVPDKFIPYLIELHAKGDFPLDEIVTFYDVHDYEKAIRDTKDGKTIKAVLKWTEGGI